MENKFRITLSAGGGEKIELVDINIFFLFDKHQNAHVIDFIITIAFFLIMF